MASLRSGGARPSITSRWSVFRIAAAPGSGLQRWRRRAVGAGLLLAGLLPLASLAPAPALAIPRLDLKPYPAPAPGERRWVIQLSGLLPPSPDLAISTHPADWRVELIAGRNLELDCNRVMFSGRLRSQPVAGTELRVVRISEVSPLASTRMACPPGEPKRRAFVPMGGKPFVVPYDVSRPIVLYAPKDLELRWRLWKAERRQWPAREF
jgi:ecotin